MQLAGSQDIFYIPKENLLNIDDFVIINCYICLSAKRSICFCENNDYFFNYICENMLKLSKT